MLKTSLTGQNFIHGAPSALGREQFYAHHPEDHRPMEPAFTVATMAEVDEAGAAAAEAWAPYSAVSAEERADFLETIAKRIEAIGDELISRASAETGLPVARLTGERGRTCNQLRMFANLLREGSWVDARIDTAGPMRAAGPKPDVRRMLTAIGPVAVFGASNFPLAFSVAGGDTASALAAGCPVVAKGHPSHPGTSELVANAIVEAVAETGMPAGTFALLNGGAEVGKRLVLQEGIKAVAFTGSQKAGKALFQLAAGRPNPIPVFAEMSSVNPIVILPGALRERFDTIVKYYAASLTAGVGQFCTNPGLMLGIDGPEFQNFLVAIAKELAEAAPGVMLNKDILCRYQDDVERWALDPRLTEVCASKKTANRADASLFSTTSNHFAKSPDLLYEVFGPAALAVGCESAEDLIRVADLEEGQLTATVHFADEDLPIVRELVPVLSRIAGRVLANGYPTGVEVGPAMQHGGPFPATTDGRFTSVGTAAIFRFARPVAYQNMPNALLPEELRDENPRGILRLLDGVPSRDKI